MSSDVANPHNNGAVLNNAQLIKAVMSSAAEAELGALYSTRVRQSRCDNSSQKWAMPNRVLPFKLTTVQHVES